MTRNQIKAVLDRVLSWPPERQAEAAMMLELMEAEAREAYQPSDEERAAIAEGLAEARRGEFASEAEMDAIMARFGR